MGRKYAEIVEGRSWKKIGSNARRRLVNEWLQWSSEHPPRLISCKAKYRHA